MPTNLLWARRENRIGAAPACMPSVAIHRAQAPRTDLEKWTHAKEFDHQSTPHVPSQRRAPGHNLGTSGLGWAQKWAQSPVPIFNNLCKLLIFWSHPPGSNRRPADYESVALPTELGWLTSFEFTTAEWGFSIGDEIFAEAVWGWFANVEVWGRSPWLSSFGGTM